MATRVPCQGAAGRGGCQRSAPTGGAAYGMPRNSSPAAAALPRTAPSAVATTETVPWFWLALLLALLLALGVAVALVHAAAVISTAVAAAPAASPVRMRCPIGIARIAALTWFATEKTDSVE